jgi:3-oxoacyl-[acyl-carrier-protein] synthase II
MRAFIHGMGLISAQETFAKTQLENPIVPTGTKFSCIEPDYTEWIDVRTIRRMSKIIRIGVASAKLALKQSGLEKPDAIITGTALGCLEDTEVFLTKMIENKEEALNPTPFIQSTHNTIGSQVALLTQCLGYNQTYTQRAFSFELALEDTLFMLNENPDLDILAGSADELTDVSQEVFEKIGWNKHTGITHGEGAAFFVINTKKENAVAELAGVKMVYKPHDAQTALDQLNTLLTEAKINVSDIDLVLSGETGNAHHNVVLKTVLETAGLQNSYIPFKTLCGEFSTATSFALWLGATGLKTQQFPVGKVLPKPVRNVLLYNQYAGQHHTLILLKAC